MRVVVTPFVVRQVHGSGRARSYRGRPSVYPTSDFPRPFLLLRGFPAVFANRCLGGAYRFVNQLPMFLLTSPGLYIGTRMSFPEEVL